VCVSWNNKKCFWYYWCTVQIRRTSCQCFHKRLVQCGQVFKLPSICRRRQNTSRNKIPLWQLVTPIRYPKCLRVVYRKLREIKSQQSQSFTIVWPCIVTDSLWIRPTDALNSNFVVITTLHVSGSLSAHRCWSYSQGKPQLFPVVEEQTDMVLTANYVLLLSHTPNAWRIWEYFYAQSFIFSNRYIIFSVRLLVYRG